ncbi:MFS transporter [Cellulosimicrobium cellulans]|uniref:MFS transporter n=1 Tax=Cellulosimicrobium cellulans TaxID=1710 RepID=UPI0019650D2D|nr:MFS transporter [Cellulosimicrobium cellulans]MBN0038917.1 MFS transporter [Cellulosimicrobium cellulans]
MTTSTLTATGRRTRARFRVLASNFTVLALNYADRAAFGVAAPFIMAEFGFSTATFGWLAAAFAFTYSPFGFIGGWLADRIGPRKTMAWAIAAWSTFVALTAVGFSFLSFLVIRLLFGAGEGPQATVTAKLMHNWFPAKERGMAVGVANAATPLGGAVGTPLVVAIMAATNDNWRLPFIIFGALGILATVGWLVAVRDTPEDDPRASAAEVAHIRDGEGPAGGADAATTAPWWTYLRLPAVWSTAVAYFGYAWILWTFLNWFPTYLVQERGIDLTTLSIGGSLPWIGGCVGMIVGGVVTDRIAARTGRSYPARRWTIVVCLAATAILFAFVGTVTSTAGAIGLMAVVILLLYFTGAQYWLVIGEAVPGQAYGSVSGAVQMFATTASIIAPVLTGYLVDSSLGWTGTFALGGAVAVLGAALLAAFGRLRTATAAVPSGAAA